MQCFVSVMLSVIMLSIGKLSVVFFIAILTYNMLKFVMPSVIMLYVAMLSFVMLNVVILGIPILSVEAPLKCFRDKHSSLLRHSKNYHCKESYCVRTWWSTDLVLKTHMV